MLWKLGNFREEFFVSVIISCFLYHTAIILKLDFFGTVWGEIGKKKQCLAK